MRIRPESECREAACSAFADHHARIIDLLPEAEVEHIGATAVEGALTKGDLDLLVRVPADRFDRARETLSDHYAIHAPEDWTPTLASFKEQPDPGIPLGVQLVTAGGVNDQKFIEWRERLSASPTLLRSYNQFKLTHAGDDPEAYIEAKAEFIEGVIGSELGSE